MVFIDLTFLEQMVFIFFCRTNGFHKFNFLEQMVQGEVLSLPPVTREDMGTYICIAQNGVPPAISKSFKLIVNCKFSF